MDDLVFEEVDAPVPASVPSPPSRSSAAGPPTISLAPAPSATGPSRSGLDRKAGATTPARGDKPGQLSEGGRRLSVDAGAPGGRPSKRVRSTTDLVGINDAVVPSTSTPSAGLVLPQRSLSSSSSHPPPQPLSSAPPAATASTRKPLFQDAARDFRFGGGSSLGRIPVVTGASASERTVSHRPLFEPVGPVPPAQAVPRPAAAAPRNGAAANPKVASTVATATAKGKAKARNGVGVKDDEVLVVESSSANALPPRAALVAEPETIDLTSASRGGAPEVGMSSTRTLPWDVKARALTPTTANPTTATAGMQRTNSEQARFAAHAQAQALLAQKQAGERLAKRELPWDRSSAHPYSSVGKQSVPSSYPGPQPHRAPTPSGSGSWPRPSSTLPSNAQQYPLPGSTGGSMMPDDAPLCIGLLSSLVLILFPVKEFEQPPKILPDGRGFAPQTMGVTLMRSMPNNKSETIKVISREGEQFGVVEHRVANVLGPFIGGYNSLSATAAAGGWVNPLRQHPHLLTAGQMRDPASSKEDSSSSSADDAGGDEDDIVETDGLGGKKRSRAAPPAMISSNHNRDLYLEACVVRRGEQAPLMLPLQLLVFCVPSSVPKVASALASANVWLEHPISYDPNLHAGCRYQNPHSHHARQAQLEQDVLRRRLMAGSYPGGAGYGAAAAGRGIVTAADPAKRTEVQREQVNEVFKSLRSGVDLPMVEPPASVTTQLYPHQKQALAFMLDREARKEVADSPEKDPAPATVKTDAGFDEGKMISLWKQKRDTYGRLVGWTNLVTGVDREGRQPPPQCRGSILADDMGLGKTITVIALIAQTIEDSIRFAGLPPTTTREAAIRGEGFDALDTHGAGDGDEVVGLSATNAWGNLTDGLGVGGSGRGKKKKESKTAKKRKEAEEDRLATLKVRSRATLIVCPLSTVQNWESQIDEHVRHRPQAKKEDPLEGKRFGGGAEAASIGVASSVLDVYVYHGIGRTSDVDCLADHDVVITTYSLLGAEYSRQHRGKGEKDGNDSSDGGIEEIDADGNPVSGSGATTPMVPGEAGAAPTPTGGKLKKKRKRKGDGSVSPLQAIQWFRVILDEAHMIKDHSTIQARAACDLVSERRACLTGTPLQNSLGDLYSLVRFLRLEPFTDRILWTAHIGAPAKLGDPLGVSRLQLIMRHLALRRTKDSKDEKGRPILALPPKKEEMVTLDLDERERAFYSQHYHRSKKTFLTMEQSDSLLKNYCSILQELLRLRQICAHMALVADSEDAKTGENTEDLVKAIREHGLSKSRAVALLALMRDTGAAQCAECGAELVPAGLAVERDDIEDESVKKPAARRGKKKVVNGAAAENDEALPPSQRPIITRCQHLFCLECFRAHVFERWPQACQATDRAVCSACREEITPVIDATEVLPSELEAFSSDGADGTEGGGKKKAKDLTRVVEHSTKIRALLIDLLRFSAANPASANFAPNVVHAPVEGDPEAAYRPVSGEVIKSIVFSQWTKLLDRIGDGLDECHITCTRLDGTMNRIERSRAMDTFRTDPKCEVMLVSLRAGGVGLNLTAASRVYVMEPFWNPAVENQAIDRVHRLGQTRPVHTIRYIISGSIEQNMLKIQQRKTELANMSLSNTLSKAQLAARRIEDLRMLFKDTGAAAIPSSSKADGKEPDIMAVDD